MGVGYINSLSSSSVVWDRLKARVLLLAHMATTSQHGAKPHSLLPHRGSNPYLMQWKEVQSLNHWTTRKVQKVYVIYFFPF